MTRSCGGWLLAFLSVLALPRRVHAGNDDEILLGNDAALMGGAVVAGVNDGSALWYNPAGLGRASGDKVDVGASAFTLRSYDYPSFVSFAGGTAGDANFSELVTVPSALTYLRRFGSRVTGGLGLFASHYNDATLRASSTLEGPGGVAQLSVLYAGELARYHLIGGVGIMLTQRLSLGIALSGDYQDDTDIFRVTVAGKPRADRDGALAATTYSSFSNGKTLGFHLRAGVTLDATERLRLGVSVESPGFYFYRVSHESNERITADVTENPASLEAITETPTRRATSMGLYAPVRVRFGGAYAVAGGTLALEGDVQSKVKDRAVDVDRVFTWNVRAGVRFPLNEHYRVGAGFFTDRGPERKDDKGAGRVDFYGGTVGLQYENLRLLAPKPGESEPRHGLMFSSTVALRYAYGTGKQLGVEFNADCPDAADGVCGRAVGVTVHELTLHLGSGLYF